jgi:catechol 2,3-dioxygenase
MPISVSKVGHLVLRVRDLDRALAFYTSVLGLREVARRDFGEGPMVFLSSGNSHHDVALVEAGETGRSRGDGLHHFALKVGNSLADLAAARVVLDAEGIPVHMALNHRVSQGLYVSDPDGNLIELYVDAPEQIWREDPTLVANSDPLTL